MNDACVPLSACNVLCTDMYNADIMMIVMWLHLCALGLSPKVRLFDHHVCSA